MTTPLVTAAFRSSQRNQYYVFNNEKYVVLDYGRGFDKKTRVIGGPIHIADGFPMFANTPFAIGIDGSFDNDGNDTFFFKGDQCVKVDFAPDIGDSRLLMVIFIITAAILTTAAASPLALTLERAFPSNNGIDLDQLRARDTTRHGRILKSSKDVVYFDVYDYIIQTYRWVLLRLNFTSRLTPEAMLPGSVAAHAMVVHRQVDWRLSSNFFSLNIHQPRPQSLVLTKGAILEPVRTISVITILSMELMVDHCLPRLVITCQIDYICTLFPKEL
ncbi:unnamed protein product [Trifolium pratense]|uniref:Uncharacterized protein n=1 Tax=Trifolium pratense TaxID=57577 RepID=A0ACB0MBV6_TRIPR|nr:unnamed protein product [Trifolium pratense]